jgi:hypothetical protein
MLSRVLGLLSVLWRGRACESVGSTGERMEQMAVAVDLEFDGGTLEQYDEVARLMDYEPGGAARRAACSIGVRSRTVVCASRTSGRPRSSLSSTRRAGKEVFHAQPSEQNAPGCERRPRDGDRPAAGRWWHGGFDLIHRHPGKTRAR